MRAEVEQAVRLAMDQLGDLLFHAEYRAITCGYSASTGEVQKTFEKVNLYLLEDSFTWTEKTNLSLESQDAKFIFYMEPLNNADITLSTADEIQKKNGSLYGIESIIENNSILAIVQARPRNEQT